MKLFISLNLLAAMWGASFLFMRIATPEFGPVMLIEVRLLFASMVLLLIWWWREPSSQKRASLRRFREISFVGATNSAIPFVLFAYSTLYVTGGFSAILNATAPIWGALIAWLWLKRTTSTSVTIGLLCGILGVVVLVSDSLTVEPGLRWLVLSAIAAGTFAAFLYGIAANYSSAYLTSISPLSLATGSITSAAILLLPFSLFYIPEQAPSALAWWSVIGMGVISTSFAYILYFYLLENMGAKALIVTFLIPLYAALWGALFIGEQVSAIMLIGGGLIFVGLGLVTGLAGNSRTAD